MIVAGIASIEVNDLSGYWLPFLLMAVMGGIVTFAYLMWMCKKLYPNYVYEGFFSMFGMLTGTISSGVLLLREIDPELKTPASNNLVTGSSFGIVFGFPMLLIISFAPKSTTTIWLSIAFVIAYLTALILFMLKVGNRKK
jgi:ESS family glutamate:Na+ symporter